jgi:ATP-dependent DNA helicase RecG
VSRKLWSDGGLPFGLRVEDLKRDHPSRPRNPLIAETFFRRGLVERWGRGTQTIVELCLQAGHPEPEFTEQAGAVGVRFAVKRSVPPQYADYVLTSRQRLILQALSIGLLHLKDIKDGLAEKVSDATLRRDLDYLKGLGLVELEGFGRGAKWRFSNPKKSS